MKIFEAQIIRKSNRSSWHVTPQGEQFNGLPVLDRSTCFGNQSEAIIAACSAMANSVDSDELVFEITEHMSEGDHK
jgi:hypothetical protein